MHVATVVLVLVNVLLVLLNVVETTAVAVAAVRHRVRIAAIDVVHHPIRVPEVVIVDVIREEGKDFFSFVFYFFLSFCDCCLLLSFFSLALDVSFFISWHIHNTSISQVGKSFFYYYFMPEQGKRQESGREEWTHTHYTLHTYLYANETRHTRYLPLFSSNM